MNELLVYVVGVFVLISSAISAIVTYLGPWLGVLALFLFIVRISERVSGQIRFVSGTLAEINASLQHQNQILTDIHQELERLSDRYSDNDDSLEDDPKPWKARDDSGGDA